MSLADDDAQLESLVNALAIARESLKIQIAVKEIALAENKRLKEELEKLKAEK